MFKLALLSVLTGGFYQVYWFYRNFRFAKESGISPHSLPMGRALFSVLWYFRLLGDLSRGLRTSTGVPGDEFVLPVSFFVLSALWRLPDPFWLLSLFSFLPLLPAVVQINRANRSAPEAYRANSSWKMRHGVLVTLLLPLWALALADTLAVVPSDTVLPGWRVWGPSRAFLENRGLLAPGEEVLYLYSSGFLSFSEDGNVLTDGRVISYWTDPFTGDFFVATAHAWEIDGYEVSPGTQLVPTVVTIAREDGCGFNLFLPGDDEEGSRAFLNELERLQKRSRPTTPTIPPWTNPYHDPCTESGTPSPPITREASAELSV